MSRVLHILSQRPGLTGSGVTLDALVREAGRRGWDQHAIVGVPADAPSPAVGDLPADRIHGVAFGDAPLDFPVPGMSDVMPYESTRFSEMGEVRLAAYRGAWCSRIRAVVEQTCPELIHAHHVWVVASMMKDLARGVPVVNHVHATGFRQMQRCPAIAADVVPGCARNDRFVVLHELHARTLTESLGVPVERIDIVGAGYRDDLFHAIGRERPAGRRVAYAGKLAASKGLPQLLEAFELLHRRRPDLELHVAGSGGGDEAASLEARMLAMAGVIVHGRLDQPALARLLRRCDVFALPSFYEGVPLVLAEAAACGCRVVATDLSGVHGALAPVLGPALHGVPCPRLHDVDRPLPGELPAFRVALGRALECALDAAKEPLDASLSSAIRGRFAWSSVFARVERSWREAMRSARRAGTGPP